MFTGIIQGTGRFAARVSRSGGLQATIAVDPALLAGVAVGDSVAVNGVCLTVTCVVAAGFEADISAATLEATTLGRLDEHALLNIERSLTPVTPLGGHLVTGHVDGVGVLASAVTDGESRRMFFTVPTELSRYIARKGSVCVDGVSLTVNAVEGDRFEVNIVPHTLGATNLGALRPGALVNVEVDLFARYLARLLDARGTA